LAGVLQRIEIPSEANISIKAHLLRLLDAHALPNRGFSTLPQESGSPNTQPVPARLHAARAALVEQLLPDSGRKANYSEDFEFTDLGCRYRVALRRSEAGEWHPGQVLSALAEAGIPLAQEVISSGRRFRVSDLVDECAAAFDFGEDIEWRSVALALYRPQVQKWKTHTGESVSFDAITDELLRRTRARGSNENACWGTHALYVLAVFQSVDKNYPLWKERSWQQQVEAALSDAADRLTQSQLADGSWDEHWELPSLTHGGTTMDDMKRMLVTGHHLEWLALVSKELRPSERVLLAAGEFILKRASDLRSDQIIKQICPCSHGLRAFGLAGIHVVDKS